MEDKEGKKLLEIKLSGLIASHKSIVEKFVYYILAINAGCIAFGMNQTRDLLMGYDKIPFLLALIFWLISFIMGLLNIKYNQLATTVNIEYIKSLLPQGNELEARQHLEKIYSLQRKLYKVDKFQNIFLALGVLSYIVWHILHMFNNAIPTEPLKLSF